jgi:hypothetical protein
MRRNEPGAPCNRNPEFEQEVDFSQRLVRVKSNQPFLIWNFVGGSRELAHCDGDFCMVPSF